MIQFDFSGQVAIVTGAGEGIGFEIARQLVAAGAKVVLNDLDPEKVRQAAQNIHPTHCIPVPGDAGQLTVIDQMVETAVSNFGRLDIAVANAGITTFGNFFEYSIADFRKLVDLNLQGSFFLAQAAARQMRKQGGGGRILFMSSTTGHLAHLYLTGYGMTKAALVFLAKSLVLELGPLGITVNVVAPGATNTERAVSDMPGYIENWAKAIPNGRIAEPDDVARAALFLVSAQSSHINGQCILVDGGWTATGGAI